MLALLAAALRVPMTLCVCVCLAHAWACERVPICVRVPVHACVPVRVCMWVTPPTATPALEALLSLLALPPFARSPAPCSAPGDSTLVS